MVEELETILSSSRWKRQSIVPQLKDSYVEDLQSLFRLLPAKADRISNGKTVNLSQVVSCFMLGYPSKHFSIEAQEACVFCLLHPFLIPSEHDLVCLAPFIGLLLLKKSPIPIVLIETIMSLDKIENDHQHTLCSSSPFLLRVLIFSVSFFLHLFFLYHFMTFPLFIDLSLIHI